MRIKAKLLVVFRFLQVVRKSRRYLPWWDLLHPSNLLLSWRVHGHTYLTMAGLVNIRTLARLADKEAIEGAFVECGVWRGGCAGIMGRFAEASGRRLWLFDSFEGMPEATTRDIGKEANELACGRKDGRLIPVGTNVASLEDVKELLHHRFGLRPTTVVFRKGWFQHTVEASRAEVGPVAILHIDADWYESTRVCLEGLYNNVAKGGFIVIDDYGFFPGCKAAVDDFLARRNLDVQLITVDDTVVYFRKPVTERS
jgi:O-methyltransferase